MPPRKRKRKGKPGPKPEPPPREAAPEYVDPALMDDAALQAELNALLPMTDQDALSDPLTLAMHLDKRMVSRPHLRVISQALAGLQPDGGDRVLITTPPQVGKTQLAVWGAFWWLCKHPSARLIVGSYGSLLATKRGRAIRKLVQTYGHRYGLVLEQGSGAANDWQLTSGGGVRSAGIGAGITGEPGSFALIDDPVKGRETADSPAIREKTWNWWSGDLTSRLAPGAPVLLVMTRWSDDDIAARLLSDEGSTDKGGRWQMVYMPAIAVPADPDRGVPADGLGREPGEPLSHPKIPTSDRNRLLRHWSDKKRSSTPRDWGALYQGDPKPVEGALIAREILRKRQDFQPKTVPIKHAVAIDPSGGGRDTAGIIAGYLGMDRRLYFTHDLSARMATEDWSEKACQLAFDTGADVLIVETNYGGDMARRVLRAAWADLVRNKKIPDEVIMPQIKMVTAKKGKVLRAEPIAQQIVIDRVRFAAPLPELAEEWATWQPTSTTSPGRIDASVHLVVGLLPIAGIQAIAGTVASPAHVSRRAATGSGASGMPYIPRGAQERGGAQRGVRRYSRVVSIDVARQQRGLRLPDTG